MPGTDFVLICPNVTKLPESNETDCKETAPSPLSSQFRKRGRPMGKHQPCSCPNCQKLPGSDRHLCHFANCGKTFTKVCHLEAHLRNHMGAKPYQCPEPGCGVRFVRPDDLKRHSFKHDNVNCKYVCAVCERGFYRKDHFNKHVATCTPEDQDSQEEYVEEGENVDRLT